MPVTPAPIPCNVLHRIADLSTPRSYGIRRSARSLIVTQETVSDVADQDDNYCLCLAGVCSRPTPPNNGMHRLCIPEILHLSYGNSFTIVVPPCDRKELKEACDPCQEVLHKFQRVIAASVTLTGVDLDKFISENMNDRVVSYNGKDSWEFNIRIYNGLLVES